MKYFRGCVAFCCVLPYAVVWAQDYITVRGGKEHRSVDVKRLSGTTIETLPARHVFFTNIRPLFRSQSFSHTCGLYGTSYTLLISPELAIPASVSASIYTRQELFDQYGVTIAWERCLGMSILNFNDIPVGILAPQPSTIEIQGGPVRAQVLKLNSFWTQDEKMRCFFHLQADLQSFRFEVQKRLCTLDASIDTRKGYGQPDREGALIADPNAELRPMNFGNWVYNGGLFAGNVPNAQDKSGTARTQFLCDSTPLGDGTYKAAVLSLFHMGPRQGFTGNLTLGAYLPLVGDTDVAENLLTWANRWPSIVPRQTPSDPPEWHQDPISRQTFPSGVALNEYANWNLAPTDLLLPLPAFHRVCVAVDNEPGPGFAWRYFASKEYNAEHPDPANTKDWAPRIWTITKMNTF